MISFQICPFYYMNRYQPFVHLNWNFLWVIILIPVLLVQFFHISNKCIFWRICYEQTQSSPVSPGYLAVYTTRILELLFSISYSFSLCSHTCMCLQVAGLECELCEFVVMEADAYLKDKQFTPAEVNNTVYKLCQELPATFLSFVSRCKMTT